MATHNDISTYNQALQEQFVRDRDWLYATEFTKSEFIDVEIEAYLNIYKKSFSENAFVFAFEALALYSYDRAVYKLVSCQDKANFLKYFSLYAYYAYLTIHESSNGCHCLQGYPNLKMQRTAHLFASNIIVKRWKSVFDMGEDFIASLNAHKCIIRRGDANALQAWFLIELYSKISGIQINKKRALYPKEFYPYDEILKQWDSTDLNEIDRFIYLLCDVHLHSSVNDDEALKMLEFPSMMLFPYEVIGWLNIREKEGLENPNHFSHPLMNEPIAYTLLEIQDPLEEPKEVPYMQEFLSYIYEHCPQMKRNKRFINSSS